MLPDRTSETRIVPVLPCIFPFSPPFSSSPLRSNSRMVKLYLIYNLLNVILHRPLAIFFFLNQSLFDYLRFFQSSRRTFSLTKKIAGYIKKFIHHSRSQPKSASFTMCHISLRLRHYSQTKKHDVDGIHNCRCFFVCVFFSFMKKGCKNQNP